MHGQAICKKSWLNQASLDRVEKFGEVCHYPPTGRWVAWECSITIVVSSIYASAPDSAATPGVARGRLALDLKGFSSPGFGQDPP